jgi:hypothetical protein
MISGTSRHRSSPLVDCTWSPTVARENRARPAPGQFPGVHGPSGRSALAASHSSIGADYRHPVVPSSVSEHGVFQGIDR